MARHQLSDGLAVRGLPVHRGDVDPSLRVRGRVGGRPTRGGDLLDDRELRRGAAPHEALALFGRRREVANRAQEQKMRLCLIRCDWVAIPFSGHRMPESRVIHLFPHVDERLNIGIRLGVTRRGHRFASHAVDHFGQQLVGCCGSVLRLHRRHVHTEDRLQEHCMRRPYLLVGRCGKDRVAARHQCVEPRYRHVPCNCLERASRRLLRR